MPEFVDPKQVLSQVGLRADMAAADFGCGSGGWVIPLASMLEDGIVYAVDIQENPLSALQGRAKMQGLSNIRTVLGNVESKITAIQDESCDFVLISDLLFQVDEHDSIFAEAARVLKPKGIVLIVEWNVDSPLGPKQDKMSPEQTFQIAQRFHFKKIKEFKAGDYHFAMLLTKG